LIKPDNGTIGAYGLEIPQDIDFVRKSFGFCPQHNQLWKTLTVADHLNLYARLRGKKLSENELTRFVDEIGLSGSMYQAAGALSGGQKRKLSVGIAFIGDPKFVILDEPSSGMDTFARRQLWEFLKSRRNGRVIMITTHFMDEADALADRVAVMAHGQLQAMGSQAFLKERFGCGYQLIAAAQDSASAPMVLANMKQIVLQHLQSLENVEFQTQGKEAVVRMPFACRDVLPNILDAMENAKNTRICSSYGLAVANLEEVFLKISDANHNNEKIRSEVGSMLQQKQQSWRNLKSKFRANLGPEGVCETKMSPNYMSIEIRTPDFVPGFFLFF